PGADSLFTTFTPAGGEPRRLTKTLASPFSFADSLVLTPGVNSYTVQSSDFAGHHSEPVSGSVEFVAASAMSAPETFHSGDAFIARLDRFAQSFEARVYRPDGAFVRRLFTEKSTGPSRLNFELPWDLTDEGGSAVGRGPYFCVLNVIY